MYIQAPQRLRQQVSLHQDPPPPLTAVCHHGGQAQPQSQVPVAVRNLPSASSHTNSKKPGHKFCVVADKDQHQVPSTAMKQELREAGLGQRRIVFKNKKGDFKHIQEGLFSNFPKLREAGGFELYRQQEGTYAISNHQHLVTTFHF